MAKKRAKSEEPKKKKPISLNILEIAKRLQKLEETGGGGGSADDVTYDPTASHLEATNVQDAIDELSGEIAGLSADDVSYDGTDSGLSAVTVQSAIDETVNKIEGLTSNDISYGTGTVMDALDKLQIESDTFNITSGYFIDNTIGYKTQGNIVTIFFNLKANTTISSNTIIGVVPDGLKPSYPVSVKSTQGDYGVYIYENGNISTLGSINDTAWVYATLTYII